MSLPLTVIGGYLGAGKTTLLNRMLTGDHGRRIAVIVNDFGALNIDASLIVKHSGDTIAMTNGCVCCSAWDGTAEAIARILKRGTEFDHIVIEASGVAEPGKIARNASAFRLPLDGVIVMADAEQLPAQASNRYVGNVVRRQLAQADLILLNKTDLVDREAVAVARSIIQGNAPGCAIIETASADVPLLLLFAGNSRRDPHVKYIEDLSVGSSPNQHEGSYDSWVIERSAPMPRAEFEALARDLSARAIRAKGHVLIAEDTSIRHLYQQVGRRWTLSIDGTWDGRPAATKVVAIAMAGSAGSSVSST